VGLTYSDPSVKANILNEQICSVFTGVDTTNIPDLGESPHPDMPDIEIAIASVNNLHPRKAADPLFAPSPTTASYIGGSHRRQNPMLFNKIWTGLK